MTSFLTSNRLIYALIAFGMSTRLVQYLHNRSLWLDEAWLALNFKTRDFIGILQHLDYNQSVPPIFLLAVKALYQVFGSSEYVLRFIPFIASLAILLLLWRIAASLMPASIPFALVLFIGSRTFIRYGSEFKQYTSDTAIALALIGFAITMVGVYPRRRLAQLAAAGAIAVWISHTAIFVLVGIGLVFFIDGLWSKRDYLLSIVGMGAVWIVSFGLVYILFYRDGVSNSYLNTYWSFAFLQPNLTSLFSAVLGVFAFVTSELYLEVGVLVVILFGFGVGLWMLPRRVSLVLLAPILPTMAASLLHLYPFSHRLVLFMLPGVILIVAVGLGSVWQRVYAHQKLVAAGIAVLLSGLFFIKPYVFDIAEARDALALVHQQDPGAHFYTDDYVYYVGSYYGGDVQPVEALKMLTSPVWVIYDTTNAYATETYMDSLGGHVAQTFYTPGTVVRQYVP